MRVLHFIAALSSYPPPPGRGRGRVVSQGPRRSWRRVASPRRPSPNPSQGEGDRKKITAIGLLLCLPLLLSACADYRLQGVVVPGLPGTSPTVEVVKQDDPRLAETGLASASLDLTLDPSRLNAKPIGSTTSGSDGSFALPVAEPGAGFLQHDVQLDVARDGYRSASERFRLPAASRRVVVTLPPRQGPPPRHPRRPPPRPGHQPARRHPPRSTAVPVGLGTPASRRGNSPKQI